jgi:hypothetical protein
VFGGSEVEHKFIKKFEGLRNGLMTRRVLTSAQFYLWGFSTNFLQVEAGFLNKGNNIS